MSLRGAKRITLHGFDGTDFEVAAVDYIAPKRDMVTLKVEGLDGRAGYPLVANPSAGSAGDSVALHGAPLGMAETVLIGARAQTGLQSGADWLKPGDESRSIFTDPTVRVLPLDITVEGGASGAPIVDPSGAVIGMLSGSRNTGGGSRLGDPCRRAERQSSRLVQCCRAASKLQLAQHRPAGTRRLVRAVLLFDTADLLERSVPDGHRKLRNGTY